ncbi:multicopper oxidase domain-containing protein [Sulfitobacter sp. S0837]|uniref:multicopper oxidase domain-containing protein n=1 Tax=Sulfitobacter maritimus TaxID=2741719 RepID=UPI0015836CFE|nr:multicopper oxidase domain-containing protein [Sulfitobacter maritimus]
MTLVNDTTFQHDIHLQGHHFKKLAQDGSLADLRDATLVAAGDSQHMIGVSENPGNGLIHCHMLKHAIEGIRAWSVVA